MARLAADLDDLRAAMDWAAEARDLRGLVGITEPVVRFWFERGLSGEVHRRLHDAVHAPGVPDDERVRGLMTAAALALAGSEPASAYRSASQAVDVARAADVGGALALGLGQRAFSGVLSGLSTSEQVDADVEQANTSSGRRCGWRQRLGNAHTVPVLLRGSPVCWLAPIRPIRRSTARWHRSCPAEDITSQALVRAAQARALLGHEDYSDAERLAREAVGLVPREMPDLRGELLVTLAEILVQSGEPNEAVAAHSEAVKLYVAKGDVVSAARAHAPAS